MEVRLARIEDSEQIAAIYNREVLSSTVTFDMVPRDELAQTTWMQAHSGAHPVLVAVEGNSSVAGFASLSPYRDRPAYATTAEDSVYVREDCRGTGLGRLLLKELLESAETRGFHAVMARIVSGHEASIRLHSGLGFEIVGVEREVGRKFGQWLDVVVMQRLI